MSDGGVSLAPDPSGNRPWFFARNQVLGERGFTLIELAVTLAVIAILASIALPDFRQFVLRNRVVTQTDSLVGDLAFARSEAIRRGENTYICPVTAGALPCNAAAGWQTGWVVYGTVNGTSNVVLRTRGALTNSAVTTTTPAGLAMPLAYHSNGTVTDGAGISYQAISFKFCDSAPAPGDLFGVLLTIGNTGDTETSQAQPNGNNQPCP